MLQVTFCLLQMCTGQLNNQLIVWKDDEQVNLPYYFFLCSLCLSYECTYMQLRNLHKNASFER